MKRTTLALLTVGLLCSRAHALDITTCNVTVPARETGVLQADLDCSGNPGYHVSLESQSTLDLNGHTLLAAPSSIAVACLGRRCLVHGPGTISGGGIGLMVNRKITIEDLTVQGSDWGIAGSGIGKLTITGVDVVGSTQTGIAAPRLILSDVSVTGSGAAGIRAYERLRGINVVSSSNGGAGIEVSGRYSISGLTANDNGQVPNREGAGLLAFEKGKLENATLTGNNYSSPSIGPVAVDIFAIKPPKSIGLTCDHSLQWISLDVAGAPLGICALD